MSYSIYVKHIVKDPEDKVINLNRNYRPGKHDLFVYWEGILCTPGNNYIESSNSSITFKEKLEEGDTVIIASSNLNTGPNVQIIGTKHNAIFKQYNNEINLMYNQEYTLEFNLLDEAHKVKFTSQYSPLYSTSKIIRSDLMDIIEDIKDDSINFTIWQNSIMAQEISTEDISEDVPYYAKQYVRYKSERDLIYAVYLAISGKAGSVSKRLGSMEVSKSIKIPFLRDMLDELKGKIEPFEKQLLGIKVVGKGFQKSGRISPYPIPLRRSF